MTTFSEDIAVVQSISAVPTILDVVCRITGMGFAAVARVTEDRWIACSVLDHINFGLKPGGELKVETTICHEIRETRKPVIIDHVDCDVVYRNHHTPRQYGFQSYISMPIFLPGGSFFGTLCAIDPKPRRLNTPEIIGMFEVFAELIAQHIDASERLAKSESRLSIEREISELREQFIGVLGHDLRNPLSAISMGARLLKESTLDEEQARTVEMMIRSVSRMSDLIDDALDFARGRLGGGITLDARSNESVEPLLKHVIEEVRTNWSDREIEVHFDLKETIRHDRKRIAQLFTNLLSNAMAHGKEDKPVKVIAVSKAGEFELSVSNAADPIPPAVMKKLFEPFSRGGAGNYQQGLGLGLYIASQIAKSHGGTLSGISTVEETRFTFTMPSDGSSSAAAVHEKGARIEKSGAVSSEKETSLTLPIAAPGVRILLIEDHADTLRSLTHLLTRRGHSVTPAQSGAEAREQFERDSFDLIVSDLALPDCSGSELIAELLALRSTPAIALSGYGTESDIQSAKTAGFSEHLTKPIDLEKLMEAVNRLAKKVVS